MIATVSALFVRSDGPYPALVEDCWTEERDARLYAGPNPCVAHPPCALWGNFTLRWHGEYGGDGGCFESAIAAIRRWGGVLEHPRMSRAWARHGIITPTYGTWVRSLFRPAEWVTEVCQRNYGHDAEKRTWLCYVGPTPPPLDWSEPAPAVRTVELMSTRQRELTPEPFARLLVSLAALAGRREAA